MKTVKRAWLVGSSKTNMPTNYVIRCKRVDRTMATAARKKHYVFGIMNENWWTVFSLERCKTTSCCCSFWNKWILTRTSEQKDKDKECQKKSACWKFKIKLQMLSLENKYIYAGTEKRYNKYIAICLCAHSLAHTHARTHSFTFQVFNICDKFHGNLLLFPFFFFSSSYFFWWISLQFPFSLFLFDVHAFGLFVVIVCSIVFVHEAIFVVVVLNWMTKLINQRAYRVSHSHSRTHTHTHTFSQYGSV